MTEAICTQARTLVHTSNLYYIEPQVRLAELLATHSFAARWFFANCGATANESAIKLARRYWAQQGTPKPHIIAAENSFHGRTLATITATGQKKYQAGFEPMMPGFSHVPYDDVAALKAAITPETGAILLEPIQGEGGVPSDYRPPCLTSATNGASLLLTKSRPAWDVPESLLRASGITPIS